MPRGPHRCVWPRTVLIGAVWRREHERGLSAGEKRMPAKARRISCTPLFQRSRSAPAGGPAGPDAFSRKSRSGDQVPAPKRTTPHATAPSSPTSTQVRSSAPAVTRTCPRVRMSTTLTGDSQPSGDALTRTSPELRHVVCGVRRAVDHCPRGLDSGGGVGDADEPRIPDVGAGAGSALRIYVECAVPEFVAAADGLLAWWTDDHGRRSHPVGVDVDGRPDSADGGLRTPWASWTATLSGGTFGVLREADRGGEPAVWRVEMNVEVVLDSPAMCASPSPMTRSSTMR